MDIKQINHRFVRTPNRRSSTEWIVYHHSVSGDVSAATIHQWHLQRGWAGIGYQYVIRYSGEVESGRGRNLVGAHARGANANSVGVCVVGDFTQHRPTDAQVRSAVRLGQYLRGIYGNLRVAGHRTFQATACPGHLFPLEAIHNGIKGGTPEVAELDWKQKQAIEMIESLANKGLLNKPENHIEAVKREGGELESYVMLSLINRLAEEVMSRD